MRHAPRDGSTGINKYVDVRKVVPVLCVRGKGRETAQVPKRDGLHGLFKGTQLLKGDGKGLFFVEYEGRPPYCLRRFRLLPPIRTTDQVRVARNLIREIWVAVGISWRTYRGRHVATVT